MITITENANSKIRSLLEAQERLGRSGLRVKVVGGGCSGLQYEMYFDDDKDELDQVIEGNRFEVWIDAMSAQYLKGAELDFLDGLNGTGFKIFNPNARETCGCGTSFGV